MNKSEERVALTIALAFVCGLMEIATHGEHGIGWFILGMFFIYS